jgi:hypothetical protein
LNDESVDSIQSVDDMGNWHVAFLVEPQSEGILTIVGFDPEGKPLDDILIPDWIRNDANWWLTNEISDSEFLEDIDYLFEKQIISVSDRDVIAESQRYIPSWVKTTADWWYEEKISDVEFLNMIQNLVKRKIIVI